MAYLKGETLTHTDKAYVYPVEPVPEKELEDIWPTAMYHIYERRYEGIASARCILHHEDGHECVSMGLIDRKQLADAIWGA
jgi:hypothetical protein